MLGKERAEQGKSRAFQCTENLTSYIENMQVAKKSRLAI